MPYAQAAYVALEFKKRYPEMFKSYERVCEEKQLEIGKLLGETRRM